MDFVTGLLRMSKGCDSIRVIVDRLTKFAHFLRIKTNYGVAQHHRLYINEIVQLHGVLVTMVSDQET